MVFPRGGGMRYKRHGRCKDALRTRVWWNW
jgi:hypothetical protein